MDARCPRCGATLVSEGAPCSDCEQRGSDGWAERRARAQAREEEAVRALGERSRGALTGEISERQHQHATSRLTRRAWAVVALVLLIAAALFVFREEIAQTLSSDPSPVAE